MKLFLLYLCLLIDQSFSCSNTKTVEKKKEFKFFSEKRLYPGKFSSGTHKTQQMCMNLRFTPNVKRTPDFRKAQSCEAMVPGLSKMEHGYIKNYFYESFDELVQQHFEKIMYFTCDTSPKKYNVKYKNYTVPSEMYAVTANSMVKKDRRIVSIAEIIKTLEKDAQLLKTESNYLLQLPLLRRDTESITSAGYLSITVFSYNAQLRDDARPNQHVLREYVNLPENWRDDINTYFEFIHRFGTHFRETTIFGGSVILLVSHTSLQKELHHMDINDSVSVTSFVNDVAKMKAGHDTRISLQSIGGAGAIQDFQNWVNSVPNEPVPIDSRFIPLNEFLDISNSKRSKSLGQVIDFEKDHQNYRKHLYQLKISNDTNKLTEYVNSMLTNQLQYICSSNYLNAIVEHGIQRGNNYNLNKYFVKFKTTNTISETYLKVRHVFENTIHLIPYVCFSFTEQVQSCSDPIFKLPGNVKCVQFFEKENCIGKGLKLYEPEGMNELFSKYKLKSVSLCDTT